MLNAHAWSRRTFLRRGGLAAVSTPFVLRALSASDALAARKLTVMTVGGSWGKAIQDMIGKPFTAKYNAETAYDQRPNAQQIAALEAMRANPAVDTIEIGGPRLGQAVALGLIEPIDPARVPNFALVEPAYKDKHVANRYVAAWALVYNTKRVDAAEAKAKGWDLLLAPKLKGKVAIPKFGWMGEMWMNAVNLTMGGTYANLDPVVAFCRKIVRENGGLVLSSNDEGMKFFTAEEIWAAPFWPGRALELSDKAVPVASTYPKGWVPYGSGFAIVKGTPNRDLAEKFVDISLSPEVQVEVAKRFSYLPTNPKAAAMVTDLPRLKMAREDMANAVNLAWDAIYKHSDKNLERFNREIVG